MNFNRLLLPTEALSKILVNDVLHMSKSLNYFCYKSRYQSAGASEFIKGFFSASSKHKVELAPDF